MTLSSWILNERIQERKKQTYIIRGGCLGSRMSHCNNSNEIITKSNIFRTEIAGTEASSPKICPFKILSCLIVLTGMTLKSAAKRKNGQFFAWMFLPNYLASARRKHLPICVVHSFASHVTCECITVRACLQAPSHALFLLVRRHPAGSSVENKFTFGKRFLSFLVSLIWISVTLQIRPWERRDKIDFGDIICKYIQQSKGTT